MKNKIIVKDDRKNIKYNYIAIFIFILTFLLLCSLSTISAANQTITDTDTGGIAQGITNTGTGDTLFLQPGTYNKTNQDTNITINKNITIRGNGSTDSVKIDARGLSRIFSINNNLNVTFINITFINGYSGNANGGAIYNAYQATRMTVINCDFINNQAPNNQGGAIANSGNHTLITGCNFSNNTANNRGGAILDNGGSFLIVNNSNFINNTATSGYGGAFHIANNPTNITVTECNFTNNTSGGSGNGGGGICIVAYNTTLIGCNFVNNTSLTGVGGGLSTGTGFYNLNLIDCNFANNTAGTSGGGAYISIANITNFINCNFINNTANASAGGLYIVTNNSTFSGCSFINNTANAGSAGGLYITGSNSICSDCNFINNTASASGGAISNQAAAANFSVINSTFANNTAKAANGGVIVNFAVNAKLINSSFINNFANITGGAISNRGTATNNYTGNITIINSKFINNSAGVGGGIYNDASALVSTNTMTGNTADLGQMIYNGGNLGILNLTYLNNSTVITNQGSTVVIYATLTDDMGNTVTGQNISFNVDDVFIANVTAIEGKANITYLVTQPHDSIIPVTGDYAGHNGYSIVLKTGELLVPRITTDLTIDVDGNLKVGENTVFISKLTDKDGNPIVNVTIDFYIDGKIVGSAVTDENGAAKLNYIFSKAGEYEITANYLGNNSYLPSSASTQINVTKIKTTTTIKVEGNKITATLTDEFGNPLAGKTIAFTLNGIVVGSATTDTNGIAIFFYKDAEEQTVTATFEGDDTYYSSSATYTPNPAPNPASNPASNPKNATTNVSGKVTMKETGFPFIPTLLALLTSFVLVSYRKKE